MADPDPDPDRLSDLPDPLLISILSLLPFTDSARSSALSPRFRHLWTFSTLHILGRHLPRNPNPNRFYNYDSDHENDNYDDGSISTLHNLLTHHRGPIHSFLLSELQWSFLRYRTRVVDSWIRILADREVRHLNLAYNIPSSIVDCKFLESLELMKFHFESPPEVPMANLRALKLSEVMLTDEVLSHILFNCRVLDSLELGSCWGFVSFSVRSESLRLLRLKIFPGRENGLVVDAPKLEVFMLGAFMTAHLHIKIVNSPKLEVVGVLNAMNSNVQIGDVDFKPELPINLHAYVHSIKTLAIKVNFCNFYQAKYIAVCLKSFPCLETLDLLIDNSPVKYRRSWKWEEESSSDCLQRTLKVVKLKGTVGRLLDLRFARFVLQNAKVLQVMSLHCVFSGMEPWRKTELHDLYSESRASLDAQVILTRDEDQTDEFSTWEGLFIS